MDLNQLYHDHQLFLMRAEAASSAALGQSYRAGATIIAGRIESIHRASGASALRHWGERGTFPDRQKPMRTKQSPDCLH